jgi:hypothetical protein
MDFMAIKQHRTRIYQMQVYVQLILSTSFIAFFLLSHARKRIEMSLRAKYMTNVPSIPAKRTGRVYP